MNRWLVIGLGNPGHQYVLTRHNVGFFVVDRLVARLGARHAGSFSTFELWSSVRPEGEIYLMKPTTFMNLSGHALEDFCDLCSVPMNQTLVVFDDVDLRLGTLRLRSSGSGGGHRGMNHIIEVLASKDIPRMRLGIDGPGRLDQALRDYVLETFDADEMDLLERVIDRSVQAVET